MRLWNLSLRLVVDTSVFMNPLRFSAGSIRHFVSHVPCCGPRWMTFVEDTHQEVSYLWIFLSLMERLYCYIKNIIVKRYVLLYTHGQVP